MQLVYNLILRLSSKVLVMFHRNSIIAKPATAIFLWAHYKRTPPRTKLKLRYVELPSMWTLAMCAAYRKELDGKILADVQRLRRAGWKSI